MLRLKPTFEEMEREAKTRRLKILPEKERRTQQGILLDDVDFNDFDLDNYDKKMIIMNENPQNGTQTDMFFSSSSGSSSKSSEKSEMEQIEQLKEELSKITSKPSSEAEQEREQPEKQKSLLRRMLDSMFDIDASSEASRANRVGGSVPSSRKSSASENNQPVETKKSNTPPVFSSSSSSSQSSDERRNRSRGSDERPVLLPVETQPTPPSVSPPVSIRSSRSNTIEYVPSSSSNRTVQYISSGSSRRTSHVSISS